MEESDRLEELREQSEARLAKIDRTMQSTVEILSEGEKVLQEVVAIGANTDHRLAELQELQRNGRNSR